MRSPRTVLTVLATGLLLAGCTQGGGTATGGGTAAGGSPTAGGASTASGSNGSNGSSGSNGSNGGAGSSSTAGSGGAAGCRSAGRAVPQGARSAPTIDVDGDGRQDTEWIATRPDSNGGIPFGIRTATGGVFSATITSASPIARSVMFADVTGHGEVIALAGDGRQVLLYAVSRCQLIPEKNPQGQQYAFDLGFTGFGTGVGCADADGDGTRDLLGLKLVTDAGGTPTSIERTIVVLKGPQARNGARSTVSSPTAAQAEQARSITCGDLTMTANGVSSGT